MGGQGEGWGEWRERDMGDEEREGWWEGGREGGMEEASRSSAPPSQSPGALSACATSGEENKSWNESREGPSSSSSVGVSTPAASSSTHGEDDAHSDRDAWELPGSEVRNSTPGWAWHPPSRPAPALLGASEGHSTSTKDRDREGRTQRERERQRDRERETERGTAGEQERWKVKGVLSYIFYYH